MKLTGEFCDQHQWHWLANDDGFIYHGGTRNCAHEGDVPLALISFSITDPVHSDGHAIDMANDLLKDTAVDVGPDGLFVTFAGVTWEMEEEEEDVDDHH